MTPGAPVPPRPSSTHPLGISTGARTTCPPPSTLAHTRASSTLAPSDDGETDLPRCCSKRPRSAEGLAHFSSGTRSEGARAVGAHAALSRPAVPGISATFSNSAKKNPPVSLSCGSSRAQRSKFSPLLLLGRRPDDDDDESCCDPNPADATAVVLGGHIVVWRGDMPACAAARELRCQRTYTVVAGHRPISVCLYLCILRRRYNLYYIYLWCG